jgi:hypothetical protein
MSLKDEKKSSERKIKEILNIPNPWRLISILPIGIPKFEEKKSRKEMADIIDYESFSTKEKEQIITEREKDKLREKKYPTPSSSREIEPVIV